MKRFSSGRVAIQQGSRVLLSDYADDGTMWTGQGDRESRHIVTFKDTFTDPPAVMVSISMWDIDHKHNARADIAADRIAEDGFHIVFRTWGDTRIARIRAEWTAIGTVADEDDWDVR
jgi:hypothetical protein